MDRTSSAVPSSHDVDINNINVAEEIKQEEKDEPKPMATTATKFKNRKSTRIIKFKTNLSPLGPNSPSPTNTN